MKNLTADVSACSCYLLTVLSAPPLKIINLLGGRRMSGATAIPTTELSLVATTSFIFSNEAKLLSGYRLEDSQQFNVVASSKTRHRLGSSDCRCGCGGVRTETWTAQALHRSNLDVQRHEKHCHTPKQLSLPAGRNVHVFSRYTRQWKKCFLRRGAVV